MSTQDSAFIFHSLERLNIVGQIGNDYKDEEGKLMLDPEGNKFLPLKRLPNNLPEERDSSCAGPKTLAHRDSQRPESKPCISKMTSVPMFVVVYGIAGMWMVSTSALLGTQITSIERHLGISSSQTGMIMSGSEVGYLIAVLFGSHFGKYCHIPRCLSLSGVMFGLATMSMSFGRFAPLSTRSDQIDSMNSSASGNDRFVCGARNHTPDGRNDSELGSLSAASTLLADNSSSQLSSLPWAFWLLCSCAFIGGVMKSSRFPLLTYYVESNIKDRSRSGMLLGTSFTAMLFGPPLTMLLGGYISTLPLDLKETSMSPQDPRWVSAWWLGFIILGAASFLFCLPIMFFPRSVPGGSEEQEPEEGREPLSKAHHLPRSVAARKAVLDMPRSMARIFRRPVFVLTLGYGCVSGLSFGFYSFNQKYVETQFNKTPSEVSFTLGLMSIFSFAVGTFLGGFLTTKLKLSVWGCCIMVASIAVVTLCLDALSLFLGCENSSVIGLSSVSSLSSEGCGCSTDDVLLVCGDDNDYLSPCFAGCTKLRDTSFTDCAGSNSSLVSTGLCSLDCNFFWPYMVTYFVNAVTGCTSIVPGYLMIVRSVDQKDQTLAIGTISFCQGLLGVLPSPVVFGKLVDNTCRLWSHGGEFCLLYDRVRMRFELVGFSMGLQGISLCLLLFIIWLVRPGSGRLKADNN